MKTTRTFHTGPGRVSASLAVVLLLGWAPLGWAVPPGEGFPLIRLERCMGSSDVPQVDWRPASEIREVTQDEIPSWIFSGSRFADGVSGGALSTGQTASLLGLRQQTNPFRTNINLTNASASVGVLSGQGVLASASVIDDKTNDASTVPMKR